MKGRMPDLAEPVRYMQRFGTGSAVGAAKTYLPGQKAFLLAEAGLLDGRPATTH